MTSPDGPRLRGKPQRGRRNPGKQPGAPGSYLAWSQDPDRAVPHFPRGACGCGADLAGAVDLGVAASHQEVEIPEMAATVIQHDLHAVACSCGRVHRAAAPAGAGAPGTVTYGIGLQAWCVYLMAAHVIPVHRCAELIEALTGAKPSPGFVHGLLARAAAAVKHANQLIRALIITASVICADETPIRAGPGPKTRKRYLLVACTNLLTYYFLGDRSLASFEAFVFPDLTGVVVHDRYQNYDKFPGIIHQLCAAHLLRDLEDAAQSYPAAIWPGQIADALRALIHAANLARDQGLAAVPGRGHRRTPAAVPPRRPRRIVPGPADPRRQGGTAARPAAAGMPARPRGRRAPVHLRPAHTPDLEPGRARRAPGEGPAEDLRPAPLRAGHPAPVRHPRLHFHRRQARHQRLHRPARRAHRESLDAAHPRHQLKSARRQSRHATKANAPHKRT